MLTIQWKDAVFIEHLLCCLELLQVYFFQNLETGGISTGASSLCRWAQGNSQTHRTSAAQNTFTSQSAAATAAKTNVQTDRTLTGHMSHGALHSRKDVKPRVCFLLKWSQKGFII